VGQQTNSESPTPKHTHNFGLVDGSPNSVGTEKLMTISVSFQEQKQIMLQYVKTVKMVMVMGGGD